jgi:addiction module HigA family antidote
MRSPGYRPDLSIPPGATLRDELRARNMTQAELATRMGRPKKTISELVNGKIALTADTAVQLEHVLGIPARFWLALECAYQEARARRTSATDTDSEWASKFPYTAMANLRWVPAVSRGDGRVRELLSFFAIATASAWSRADLAEAVLLSSPSLATDKYALSAWLRKGEVIAQAEGCGAYNPVAFREALDKSRRLIREGPDRVEPGLRELCGSCGVSLVFLPELPRMRVRGAARLTLQGNAIIQLSLRHKTDDHLWFSFYHEAAHLILHMQEKPKVHVDLVTDGGQGHQTAEELAANRFAEEFLIPSEELTRFLRGKWRSRAAIEAFAENLSITPGIAVGRLQHAGHLKYSEFNSLKVRFAWA